jgi:hypothetical protein
VIIAKPPNVVYIPFSKNNLDLPGFYRRWKKLDNQDLLKRSFLPNSKDYQVPKTSELALPSRLAFIRKLIFEDI